MLEEKVFKCKVMQSLKNSISKYLFECLPSCWSGVVSSQIHN